MKRFRVWLSFIWRFSLAMIAFLILFAAPIFYILFASTPLQPWAMLTHWMPDHLGWRLIGVALFVSVLNIFFSFLASRSTPYLFQEIATFIQRIGAGDFRARIGVYPERHLQELAQIREALNTMAADLQRAEELRSSMMADVSHELRTPLTALEGNLRAALDGVYPLDEAEIATLYGQTRHLIRLVNDLHELALADARQLPLAMQPTDLAVLVGETLQIFAPLAAEQGVALSITTCRLPLITVDSVRIRQVLHNLLTNALRHTPLGGAISVSSTLADQQVIITVTDTGDGLEPEHLSAVFDRFYRTDKSRSRDTGGTGLGLAIVSAIVATHGGTVDAWSAGLGRGSTFTIRLPTA